MDGMERLINRLRNSKIANNPIFRQFIKFGIIGLSNTALSYVLYLVFLRLLESLRFFPDYDYLISSVVTFCICVVWSFYWNNRFTFKMENGENRNLLKAFAKTVLCYSITGLVLQNILLYIFVEFFFLPKEMVPLLVLFVTVPLNFIMNKFWAFKSTK